MEAPPAAIEQTIGRKRPFGVYAIVAIQLLDIGSLYIQTVSGWRGLQPLVVPGIENPRLIAAINLLIIALLASTVVGLLRLRRWAWLLTMILTGSTLLFRIVLYFQGAAPAFNLVFGVLVVFYLNQRSVQQRFKRRESGAGVDDE